MPPQPAAQFAQHRQALPQLLSAVRQHALELRSCQRAGLSPEELAEVQAAAHEALKQGVEQAKGSDESLRKMVDELASDGPAAGQDAAAVLGKLDALAARMESMQAQHRRVAGCVYGAHAHASDGGVHGSHAHRVYLGCHQM